MIGRFIAFFIVYLLWCSMASPQDLPLFSDEINITPQSASADLCGSSVPPTLPERVAICREDSGCHPVQMLFYPDSDPSRFRLPGAAQRNAAGAQLIGVTIQHRSEAESQLRFECRRARAEMLLLVTGTINRLYVPSGTTLPAQLRIDEPDLVENVKSQCVPCDQFSKRKKRKKRSN